MRLPSKRGARELLKQVTKQQRVGEPDPKGPDLPEWPKFSNLDGMVSTPIPATLLDKGLRQKNASISFFQEIAAAAASEGSTRYQTRCLSRMACERRLHTHVSKDLPKIRSIQLPIVLKKAMVQKPFSALLNFF